MTTQFTVRRAAIGVKSNARAIRFYERLGFRTTGEESPCDGNGQIGMRMERPAGPAIP